MSLKVAVQMDPIHPIDINADSTFALMLEAQGRGHELFYYLPNELAWTDGTVKARLRTVQVRREKGNHYTLGEDQVVDLRSMDVVLLRQDPPYDMSYLTTTWLLERIHPREPSDAVLLQLDSVARIGIGLRFAIERRKPCIQGRTSVLVGHLNRADGCDR